MYQDVFISSENLQSVYVTFSICVARMGGGEEREGGGGLEKGEEGWEEGLPAKLIKTETVVITFMFFI